MKDERKTTLVLGGTGKTGKRVAERLEARGWPVRVGSRSGTPPFDWAHERTWRPALDQVGAVYVSYHPDLAAPGAAETLGAFADVAVGSGARRIVLLSGRGEPQAQVSEEAVRASGADLTVLQAAWFSQNFSEGHWFGSVMEGELALPAGTVAEPFIDVEDIADVAVAALMDDVHIGETYELTGPRLVTFEQAASEVGEAAGRPVRYVPISPEEFGKALATQLPPDDAAFVAELFPYLLDGHNAHLTGDVERVLGRKPRDFREFAQGAARAGVWAR